MGLVKQVGPPSHPMHRASPSNSFTFTPELVKASLVLGRPESIIHSPGEIAKTLMLRVELELNSLIGASINSKQFSFSNLNKPTGKRGVWTIALFVSTRLIKDIMCRHASSPLKTGKS